MRSPEKQPQRSVAARHAAFALAMTCWSPPAHAARNCTPATPDAGCRVTNVCAAEGVGPERTADCSTARLAASAAAWLPSKHAAASSHMAGSHAAPTRISHARHRTHWAPAHSPPAQNVLNAVLPCRWPQLSRMATCTSAHGRSAHTGVGQVSHGGQGRLCASANGVAKHRKSCPLRGWSQLGGQWWAARTSGPPLPERTCCRAGRCWRVRGPQPRCLWRRGGGGGRQGGCGLAPGPTLLHALSPVVPRNVPSIGEHSAVPVPPQVSVRVALPTSHYAPASKVRRGAAGSGCCGGGGHTTGPSSCTAGCTCSCGTTKARAARPDTV